MQAPLRGSRISLATLALMLIPRLHHKQIHTTRDRALRQVTKVEYLEPIVAWYSHPMVDCDIFRM